MFIDNKHLPWYLFSPLYLSPLDVSLFLVSCQGNSSKDSRKPIIVQAIYAVELPVLFLLLPKWLQLTAPKSGAVFLICWMVVSPFWSDLSFYSFQGALWVWETLWQNMLDWKKLPKGKSNYSSFSRTTSQVFCWCKIKCEVRRAPNMFRHRV